MGDVSKEFDSMSFLGQWIAVTRAFSDDLARMGLGVTHLQLHVLSFRRGLD